MSKRGRGREEERVDGTKRSIVRFGNELSFDPTKMETNKKVSIGNYTGYHAFRFGKDGMDPRVEAMKEEWIQGKKILDVGCNEGMVTLCLADRFQIKSILGIDVDGKLIKKARRNLYEARKRSKKRRLDTIEEDVKPLKEVSFSSRDIVEYEMEDESLDTVLCLSVIKWIHLTKGDEGVRNVFQKIQRLLVPGGWLIFEPQPWISYRQAFRKGQVDASKLVPLKDLTFHPNQFVSHLVNELGFKLMDEIRDLGTGKRSFDRVLYAFQKA